MIWLEIFGYCGTALVLLSMMMTSVVKLRILNSAGSLISMTYAYLCNTWPVVLLNLGLLLINVYQLIRLRRVRVAFHYQTVSPEDRSLLHFFDVFEKDIQVFFPQFTKQTDPNAVVYVVYREAEPAGVLLGIRQGDCLQISLDYTTPQYRDCSVAAYLFDSLKSEGYSTVTAAADTKAHAGYLRKMGFAQQNGIFTKQL